jgi:hypothetical protein
MWIWSQLHSKCLTFRSTWNGQESVPEIWLNLSFPLSVSNQHNSELKSKEECSVVSTWPVRWFHSFIRIKELPCLLDLGFGVRNVDVNKHQRKPYIWNPPVKRNSETWEILTCKVKVNFQSTCPRNKRCFPC